VQPHEKPGEGIEQLVAPRAEAFAADEFAIGEGKGYVAGDHGTRPFVVGVGPAALDQADRFGSTRRAVLESPQDLELVPGQSNRELLDGIDPLLVGHEHERMTVDALRHLDDSIGFPLVDRL